MTGPNEPDLDRQTKVHWTPAPLAAFQKQIYDQVKAVDPSILVGSPAFWKTWLVPTEKDPWPLSRAKLQEFIVEICKLKSNTGGPIVDFWAFHGYDDPAVHATYNIWSWWFPDGKFAAGSTMTWKTSGPHCEAALLPSLA